MREFHPIANASPSPGLVLRVGDDESRVLRITHVFDTCVYVMWVKEAENAYNARRPIRMSLQELNRLAGNSSAAWGRLALPPALSESPQADSERRLALDAVWKLIEPLIKSFESEANLSHRRFTALIRGRAEVAQVPFITLNRLVLRYYYFGGTRLALMPLPRGRQPGHAAYPDGDIPSEPAQPQKKRRGRQPILSKELGTNDFIISDEDITDMFATLKSCLLSGPTFITHAYEKYLAGRFRRRHPAIYAEYTAGKRLEPITLRQLRYYIHGRTTPLDDDLLENLRTGKRNQGYLGSLHSAGPGEVYEIDSTGGRFYLVSTDDPPVKLEKPTIYLIIDRWSRYIVSAYITLRAPSYEEVRHALLVAFTSRRSRFEPLGIDIDDDRWPVGRFPAELCPDRGTDFVNASMKQSVVQDLRIDLTPLPPFCPDGKAIVERMIREIKRRMAGLGIKGVFAETPLDPITKRAARKAAAAAVHSIAEAYRVLIEIIDDHNNRPHSALRRRRILTQAGVRPIPKDAYLWGLKNITGLRTAPLTDNDYQRLLLSTDTAGISNGVLRYRSRSYLPENESAFELGRKSTTRVKQINVRLDKTCPHEIFAPTSRGEWAKFIITYGGASELAGVTLDEEDALASRTALLWAQSEHDARVGRLVATGTKSKGTAKHRQSAIKLNRQEQNDARRQETTRMKKLLTGKSTMPVPDSDEQHQRAEDWRELEETERLRNLELIRKDRGRR